MQAFEIAPGAHLTVIPGEKFKRSKVSVNLVLPSRREDATALALLPHVLDRRCAAIPDPTALSRHLYQLYGAGLVSESYTAGASRVLTFGVTGLKNEFALDSEDLAAEYLDLLCNILFAPKLSAAGVFEAEDVDIEREKQADYLRSEMNDKRSYCLRQARRKAYANSPLGIESPGYLEDLPGITPEGLFAVYQDLLRRAQVEVLVCGIDGDTAATALRRCLEKIDRAPAPIAQVSPLAAPTSFERFEEEMDTVQGKLCIVYSGAGRADARGEAVMRVASAIYGGLPTSRLFTNVREKQSLCYYCAASYGFYGGTLVVDSGVDHDKAAKAAEAMMKELADLQREAVSEEEIETAKRYLSSVFSTAKDSASTLMNWVFNEQLRGTKRTLDEALAMMLSVTPAEVQAALAAFKPAVQYAITGKEGT